MPLPPPERDTLPINLSMKHTYAMVAILSHRRKQITTRNCIPLTEMLNSASFPLGSIRRYLTGPGGNCTATRYVPAPGPDPIRPAASSVPRVGSQVPRFSLARHLVPNADLRLQISNATERFAGAICHSVPPPARDARVYAQPHR